MKLALCVLLASLGACSEDDLAANQGMCTGLEEMICQATTGCQFAYVESGFRPSPAKLKCLAVEPGKAVEGPCTSLAHDECRARDTCAPVYRQPLGPTDSPQGDPIYDRCTDEMIIVF